MKAPIKLKFKHDSPCTKPFGICIIIPLSVTCDVTPKEYEEGFGIACADVVERKLHLVFMRRAALDDGTIPIPDYWDLGEEVAKALGYKKIIVKPGTYKVNFSNYPQFGEAFFEAELEK